ncbi:hypothetical protein [Andreprevotia sp. IGB-42]|uniref:hypothetical protein n=1 Tax=Andreprevotia sp. IGB-42 TaxID=2497473 RepID=UPI0013573E55|nr:hypothetical protein [Andreprevotia sp. IGB-42]
MGNRKKMLFPYNSDRSLLPASRNMLSIKLLKQNMNHQHPALTGRHHFRAMTHHGNDMAVMEWSHPAWAELALKPPCASVKTAYQRKAAHVDPQTVQI